MERERERRKGEEYNNQTLSFSLSLAAAIKLSESLVNYYLAIQAYQQCLLNSIQSKGMYGLCNNM